MIEALIVLLVLSFIGSVTVYVIASAAKPQETVQSELVTLCDQCMTFLDHGDECYLLMSPTPDGGMKIGGALCPKCGRECIEWLVQNGFEGLIDA